MVEKDATSPMAVGGLRGLAWSRFASEGLDTRRRRCPDELACQAPACCCHGDLGSYTSQPPPHDAFPPMGAAFKLQASWWKTRFCTSLRRTNTTDWTLESDRKRPRERQKYATQGRG